MKTPKQILNDLIADFISLQNRITYLGKSSVVRAIFSAVAFLGYELWHDIYLSKRKLYPQLATGSDLDTIGTRLGITRRGAAKSSVVLLFNGTSGTVIPAGTKVKSYISGVEYITLYSLTLGTANPTIIRPINSNYLGDIVLAESLDAGEESIVGVKELIVLPTPISGVNSVTNLSPSAGGADAESDEQYRYRIINYVDLLAQGTADFYVSLAKEADSTVIKAAAKYNAQNIGVDVYLVKDSGATYSGSELITMQDAIYAKQKAMNVIVCFNAQYKAIDVSIKYTRDTAYTDEQVFRNIATAIADIVNVDKMNFGSTLKYSEIVNAVLNADGVKDLDFSKFKINGGTLNITCLSTEIPKFSLLTIDDSTTIVTKPIS